MSSTENVLKQGESLTFAAANIDGAFSNVTFTSTHPSLVSVSNSGVVTVLQNPSKVIRVSVSAKDEFDIYLAGITLYVIPSSMNKADVFSSTTTYSLSKSFLKLNETSQLVVNSGLGPHQGITYESKTPSLLTVNSTGLITCVGTVTVADPVRITARDASGTLVKLVMVTVLPQSANISKLSAVPTVTVTINESP